MLLLFYLSYWTVLFDSVTLARQTGQLRWLSWIFHGGYLPSLIVNCVGMSNDMGRGLPQLYYIKMKIYDLSFIAIRVAMATKTRQQSKHSCWVLPSPWCGTALVIYPSKRIKCHCKIILKEITFWRTHLLPKQEKDWMGTQSSPHTLQVQNGGPVNLI